jgi:hypothetical protein
VSAFLSVVLTSSAAERGGAPAHSSQGPSAITAAPRNTATTRIANSSHSAGASQRSRSSGVRAVHHNSNNVHGTQSAALSNSDCSTGSKSAGWPRAERKASK